MAAFDHTILYFWHIAKSFDSQFLFHQLFHSGVKHRGHLIEDHTLYAAVFFVFHKTLYVGSEGNTHSLAVYDQNYRSIRNPRQIIGACLCGGSSNSIVKSHDPFHHRHFTVCTVFGKKRSGDLFPCEKGIQIPGFGSNDLGVEHRVNIIRSAFKRDCFDSPVYKHLQKSAGQKGFPAPAGSCRKHNPWYCF